MKKNTPSQSNSKLFIIALVVFFIILLATGTISRLRTSQERKVTAQAQKNARSAVRTAMAVRTDGGFEFNLPGTAEPLQDTMIYARTNGYLKERLVDLGDVVTSGQLLATIDTPEVDAQLNQARAALRQVQAAGELTRLNLNRQKDLAERSVVSRQDLDTAEANASQATANITAAAAQVTNLQAQQKFNQVTAPFAGTIIERNFDTGALISGGSAALFRIADVSTLRIYVTLPQNYAGSVRPGDEVAVTRPEASNQIFRGRIVRTSGALDAATRTEKIEIQIPNPNGQLLAGMYLTLRFKVAPAAPVITIPASTLDIRKEGPRVATLETKDGQLVVAFRKVTIGRDLGTTLELNDGLKGGEKLVTNPTTELTDGMVVKEVQAAK